MNNSHPLPDTLNSIGVLKRREIEARILSPFVNALSAEFGAEQVHAILRATILEVARQQGAAMALQAGKNDLDTFAKTLENWTKDNALVLEVVEQTPQRFAFNVQRCRYAEMYQALGIPELGALLSCSRDLALTAGFNPNVKFNRSQTLMEGADYCDFHYELDTAEPSAP